MEINYLAVLVCAVLSMVIGSIWYGPLFGKKWMQLAKIEDLSEEKKKEMRKGMWKTYLLQFALSLFQIYVLAWYINTLSDMSSGVHTAFSLFIAFIMPTLAGGSLWNGDSNKDNWTRFWLTFGANLVSFIVYGFVLGMWK